MFNECLEIGWKTDTVFHHQMKHCVSCLIYYMKVCLRSLFPGKEVRIPHSLLILPIPSVSHENLACRTSVIVIQNIVSFCNPHRFDPCPHFGESHILPQTQYPVNLAFREFLVVFGQILDPGIKNPSRTPFPSNYSNSSCRLKLALWGNPRKSWILYSTPWIPDSINWFRSFCQLNLDSGFEWLVGFRNPWAVFLIPVITRRDVLAIMLLQLNTCICFFWRMLFWRINKETLWPLWIAKIGIHFFGPGKNTCIPLRSV